jgi:signal transduction histidine kinase
MPDPRADHREVPGGDLPVSEVGHAVRSFVVRSVAAALVLTVVAVYSSHLLARHIAIEDAKMHARNVARVITPFMDEDVRQGSEVAREQLDRALLSSIEDGTLSHIKLWAEDGSVLWSDNPELQGQRFELEDDVVELFGTRQVTAEVSGLEKAENAAERDEGELVEVYVGAFDQQGRPWVFEAYLATGQMASNESALMVHLVPLTLGGIVLLLATMLPLAVRLARHVERAQQERGKLLRHALLASELERRRVAQDLHDGVVQDLAGLGYAVGALSERLPSNGQGAEARDALEHVREVLERDVPALRAVLTDVYPPDLAGEGLAPALEDLAARAEGSGVRVTVVVDPVLALDPESARIVYRVVREGLRNVVKHARTDTAEVHLQAHGEDVLVRVVDQGQGLGDRPPDEGHLGLRLLRETLEDFGGSFELTNAATGGAIMEARLPAQLVVPS